jgi:uncharacterized damage-inducible protein DinB
MANRRSFLKQTVALTTATTIAPIAGTFAHPRPQETGTGLYLIGPTEGYAPFIGTLLGTMNMMRTWVKNQVENLSPQELDWQIDDQSNSIGAMLWHLAATERYYQLNTFENMEWGSWNEEIKAEWDLPMNLGEEGREKIKGHKIDFYFEKLDGVRAETERWFATLDDDWLWKSEEFFGNEPTNNYAKWFHVCEHESNHNGQIKFLKKRM